MSNGKVTKVSGHTTSLRSLDALVEECPFPAGVVDLDELRYVSVNDAAAELFALDYRPVGEVVLQFVQDQEETAWRLRSLRGREIHWFETAWRFQAANGRRFSRPALIAVIKFGVGGIWAARDRFWPAVYDKAGRRSDSA